MSYRDPYERNNAPYSRLPDNNYRSPPPRNDYYRNPSTSAATGGSYYNQSSGYSNNYNQGSRYNQGSSYNQGSNYNQDSSYNQGSSYKQGYSNNYGNNDYDNVVSNYAVGGGLTKPQPAATKPLNPGQGTRNGKVRSALFNPEVRRQLEKNSKKYKPYFIYAVTGIQVLVLLISYILNFKNTGSPITDIHENFFLGPAPGVSKKKKKKKKKNEIWNIIYLFIIIIYFCKLELIN